MNAQVQTSSTRIYYCPELSSENEDHIDPNGVFIPAPYSGYTEKSLAKLGLTFRVGDFKDGIEGARRFLKEGIVSIDRTVAVIFCDLKGSTEVLNYLSKSTFVKIQDEFFASSTNVVIEANSSREPGDPRAVLDKFMGDAVMIYVDAGDTEKCENSNEFSAFLTRRNATSQLAIRIVKSIATSICQIDDKYRTILGGSHLGARFGVSLGGDVILSVLGLKRQHGQTTQPVGNFTLTGSIVNLASRLEHATAAEFLEAIAQLKRQNESFTSLMWQAESLRATMLGEELESIDARIADLYEVCKMNLEIRADSRFVTEFELGGRSEKLAWKKIPFSPRGFFGRQTAMLLGGNSVADLFRRI